MAIIEGISTDMLLNYGVLGLWTATLLYNQYKLFNKYEAAQVKLQTVVDNNTIALTKVYEVVENCKKNGK